MPGPTVLVVEDDEKSRELTSEILAALGFEVAVCETAEECLELAAGIAPAIIFMDIRLPGMSGTEALQRLRAMPSLGAVPVVAVTASVMPLQRSAVMDAGFDGFISKPISIKAVRETVNELLGIR